MKRLTEIQVRKAKPREVSFKMADGGGMYLLVHHNRSTYWRINYQIDVQQRTQVLGVWPQMSLKAARESETKYWGLDTTSPGSTRKTRDRPSLPIPI